MKEGFRRFFRKETQNQNFPFEVTTPDSLKKQYEQQVLEKWEVFSRQMGRIYGGAEWNAGKEGENIPDWGLNGWQELMMRERRLGREGLKSFLDGLSEAAWEKRDRGEIEGALGGPADLAAKSIELHTDVLPAIGSLRKSKREKALQQLTDVLSRPPAAWLNRQGRIMGS